MKCSSQTQLKSPKDIFKNIPWEYNFSLCLHDTRNTFKQNPGQSYLKAAFQMMEGSTEKTFYVWLPVFSCDEVLQKNLKLITMASANVSWLGKYGIKSQYDARLINSPHLDREEKTLKCVWDIVQNYWFPFLLANIFSTMKRH